MADTRLISFTSAGQDFAVPISSVREVVRVDSVEPVPGSRSPLEGIYVYRGSQILPVFSLPEIFGVVSGGQENLLMVVDIEGETLGFRIERIGGVADTPPVGEVEEYSGDLQIDPGAIRGVWKSPRGAFLLLRLNTVFGPYIA
jgi:purine-binding chemotaxis protein CheW